MGQPSRPLATTSRTIYNFYTIRHHPRKKEHTYKKPRRYFAIIQISCLLKDDAQSSLEKKNTTIKRHFQIKNNIPLLPLSRGKRGVIFAHSCLNQKNFHQNPTGNNNLSSTPYRNIHLSPILKKVWKCVTTKCTLQQKFFSIRKFRLTPNKLLKIFRIFVFYRFILIPNLYVLFTYLETRNDTVK